MKHTKHMGEEIAMRDVEVKLLIQTCSTLLTISGSFISDYVKLIRYMLYSYY